MKLNEITKEALTRMPKRELASLAEDLFALSIDNADVLESIHDCCKVLVDAIKPTQEKWTVEHLSSTQTRLEEECLSLKKSIGQLKEKYGWVYSDIMEIDVFRDEYIISVEISNKAISRGMSYLVESITHLQDEVISKEELLYDVWRSRFPDDPILYRLCDDNGFDFMNELSELHDCIRSNVDRINDIDSLIKYLNHVFRVTSVSLLMFCTKDRLIAQNLLSGLEHSLSSLVTPKTKREYWFKSLIEELQVDKEDLTIMGIVDDIKDIVFLQIRCLYCMKSEWSVYVSIYEQLLLEDEVFHSHEEEELAIASDEESDEDDATHDREPGRGLLSHIDGMSSDSLRKVLKGLISGRVLEQVIAELIRQHEE